MIAPLHLPPPYDARRRLVKHIGDPGAPRATMRFGLWAMIIGRMAVTQTKLRMIFVHDEIIDLSPAAAQRRGGKPNETRP